jgi:uncharacterized membrane protein
VPEPSPPDTVTEARTPMHRTRLGRVVVAGGAGVVAAVISGLASTWQGGALVGWVVTALTWLGPTWLKIGTMNATSTRTHATQEDPHGPIADSLLLAAAVASLGAVVLGVLKAASSQGATKLLLLGAGIAAVVASWALVHTVFALRYASLYYREMKQGADFHDEEAPDYGDFAYLAFTIGMTYQVSDTDLTTRSMRHAALRHALLSYLLGTVVIAATVNLAAGLAH